MTRFPTESRNVVPVEPDDDHPLYRVGPVCATPGCSKLTDHNHHLFSRGLMGGAFDWVELEDGTQIYNHAPLCFKHHEMVTDNEVAITWDGEKFLWDDNLMPQPLKWQPQVIWPHHDEDRHPHVETVSREEAIELGAKPYEYCPTCKRKYRNKKQVDPFAENPHEQPRRRLTVGISVPTDRTENGAEVLEELFEAAREKLEQHGIEYGGGRRNNYFLLSTVLALFVTHGDQILSDS